MGRFVPLKGMVQLGGSGTSAGGGGGGGSLIGGGGGGGGRGGGGGGWNRGLTKPRGTWLKTSGIATLTIIRRIDSRASTISIFVKGRLHEEHYISALKFIHSKPQGANGFGGGEEEEEEEEEEAVHDPVMATGGKLVGSKRAPLRGGEVKFNPLRKKAVIFGIQIDGSTQTSVNKFALGFDTVEDSLACFQTMQEIVRKEWHVMRTSMRKEHSGKVKEKKRKLQSSSQQSQPPVGNTIPSGLPFRHDNDQAVQAMLSGVEDTCSSGQGVNDGAWSEVVDERRSGVVMPATQSTLSVEENCTMHSGLSTQLPSGPLDGRADLELAGGQLMTAVNNDQALAITDNQLQSQWNVDGDEFIRTKIQEYLLDPNFHAYVARVERIWDEIEHNLSGEMEAVRRKRSLEEDNTGKEHGVESMEDIGKPCP
ncbi:hypothetical protein CBR_g19926 [Chara braunii]|uniref:Poor homologous synapsis 1 PH domain-containing protein n=1 Tax=Chara braunii TaxID=69332 RepID=A0A388KZ07_CHABU|nr:hypothetical protein CBR_g19926 [Chara braunii]|eukprot:GBG75294.1 hypothetical protein CBR_g19926 [Chara braunii]